jgi:hypothetical protein
MTSKTLSIILGVVIVVLLAILAFVPGRNTTVAPTATSTETGSINNPVPTSSVVDVPGPSPDAILYAYKSVKGRTVNAYLAPNSTVISPLTVTGNVPAGWAFEASFPAQLLDANGKLIGQGIARVPNWMSTTTAWYAVSVSFSKPTTSTGTLVFKRDNASGLPENDDQVRIPVKF